MAIAGIESNYRSGFCENTYTAKNTETEQATETNSTTGSTAADELAYLSRKYSNYSFVSANYTKGMQYGSISTVNVVISPQFLAKMANDSELEAEYEGYLSDMKKLDEQEDAMRAGTGWSTVARGWVIDKDGGISKWGISKKDDGKTFLQKMSENAEKIRKQNEEKKKEKAELAEKRELSKEEKTELKEKLEKTGKEKLGEKFKGVLVLGADEKTDAGRKENAAANGYLAGTNVDVKA